MTYSLLGSASCTVTCGYFGFFSCPAVTCQVANPWACTTSVTVATPTCEAGFTQVTGGTKCYKVSSLRFVTKNTYIALKLETTASNWLAALQRCIALGGTLAKIESAAEQAIVANLIRKLKMHNFIDKRQLS